MNGTGYEETTGWPAWIWVLLALTCAIVFYTVGNASPDRVLLVMTLPIAVFVAIWFFFGSLRVRVNRDGVVIAFGRLDLVKKRVAFDDIQSIEPVKYSPLLEFGGWGIKWGRGGKVAWTMSGNQALVLHLKNGKHLYVGSAQPAKLAERVRQSAGPLLETSKRPEG